ncbi:hypothetical protein AWH56_018115 [Anaerobacillus isosaccharinicus]|uniref:Uncharacterized protein n=1 Tax=Anaerobacillus isosaccharinicus TaxID=1532552 RepID=A0A1S2ME63_9BACI|nr:hypothetical protein [Anaerobacillus isosaccharinicus]MBA5587179.1 hypothetical protein [Anaerobacillus isosaccharinicus]QOY34625.1 hypothetical protein AWH56_018115 [Anaerobacillus isosaccharinicus]
MREANKLSIYIVCLIISFFSCYALYKLYETSLILLEKYPEIDNVAIVGFAMVFAPVMLFIFNVVFYLFVYEKSIKKSPKQISSWRILLLNKDRWSLNLIRVLLYLLCFWIIADNFGAVPIWIVITLLINIVSYGYWTLQMVRESLLFERTY